MAEQLIEQVVYLALDLLHLLAQHSRRQVRVRLPSLRGERVARGRGREVEERGGDRVGRLGGGPPPAAAAVHYRRAVGLRESRERRGAERNL